MVTGGGRGIGRAIAETLATRRRRRRDRRQRHRDRRQRRRSRAWRRAWRKALGERAAAFTESIASPSAAQAAVELAVRRFGGLDIVVNNAAAILRDGFIFKADPEDWDAVMRTNLSAAFHVLAAATPVMREQAKAERGGKPLWLGPHRQHRLDRRALRQLRPGRLCQRQGRAGRPDPRGRARHGAQRRHLQRRRAVRRDPRHRDRSSPPIPAQATYKERALKVPARAVARARRLARRARGEGRDRPALRRARPRDLPVRASRARSRGSSAPAPSGLGAAIAQALAPHYAALETRPRGIQQRAALV